MILTFSIPTDQVDHFSGAILHYTGTRIIAATPESPVGDNVRLEVSTQSQETAQAVMNLYFNGTPTAPAPRVFPTQMTPPIEDVLCRMLMETTPIAHLFRETGEEIPRKVEREQAFVLFWMLGLAIEHGADWRKKAAEELNPRIERAKAQRSAAAFPGGRPVLDADELATLRRMVATQEPESALNTVALRGLIANRLVEPVSLRITGEGRIWLDTQPKQPVPA